MLKSTSTVHRMCPVGFWNLKFMNVNVDGYVEAKAVLDELSSVNKPLIEALSQLQKDRLIKFHLIQGQLFRKV